jgi:hypothetical protein
MLMILSSSCLSRALSFWSYQTTQEAYVFLFARYSVLKPDVDCCACRAYQALLLSKSQEYNAVAKQQLQNSTSAPLHLSSFSASRFVADALRLFFCIS